MYEQQNQAKKQKNIFFFKVNKIFLLKIPSSQAYLHKIKIKIIFFFFFQKNAT